MLFAHSFVRSPNENAACAAGNLTFLHVKSCEQQEFFTKEDLSFIYVTRANGIANNFGLS